MHKISLIFLFLLLSLLSFGQQQLDSLFSEKELKFLTDVEDTLVILSYSVVNDSITENRFAACHEMIPMLVNALKTPASFYYPFDRLQSVSIQYPEDSTFRIFSWQLYLDKGKYRYYGAIQMNTGELKLFPLIDRSNEVNFDDEFMLPQKWFGALIYNIRQFDSPEGRKYLVFGFHRGDFFKKDKFVEVLHFSGGEAKFGYPSFKKILPDSSEVFERRIFLEYYAEADIRLNYDPVLDMIIFEHLITFNSEKGPLRVPDGSYEGYKFENGVWVYQEKLFHEVMDEPPMVTPVKGKQKKKDILGREK